jgi:N-acetylglutamate synthase
MKIQKMTIRDYRDVFTLWKTTPGIGLHEEEDDSIDGIRRYLKRNPGMSFVARENGQVVGAVLSGHDGRRGYLHHLAVAATHQKKGIGKALVERVMARLKAAGILKCHIFVFGDNDAGQRFWKHLGWKKRTDLYVMTQTIGCC